MKIITSRLKTKFYDMLKNLNDTRVNQGLRGDMGIPNNKLKLKCPA